MSNLHLIHTPDEAESERCSALLSILEVLLPVKFSCSQETHREFSGELITLNGAAAARRSRTDVSSFSTPRSEPVSREGELLEIAVRFSDEANVPFPFRGRSLRTQISGRPDILSLTPGEKPLATCELGPVWAFSEGESAKHFRSGFALPVLPADGSLMDVLSGRRFLEMLPLLHWLRQISASSPHSSSPLKASFIFDDPNLHWPRYGFVDYRQLATHAEKENYHVSFATIPLDTWFTHRGAAEIFRNQRNRLSLLVHGNNHTKRELARPYTEAERIFLLRQAIQRIERLERRSGLVVSRVMVPPHGACSEEMLAALQFCGFEAACISHGSLRAHNKSRAWTKTLGYLPSELVRGCPVLPRWGVTGDLKNTILLAAFLKQAIILRGHHQDLKNGPELLDELARIINGLGSVKWSNMTDMTRSTSPSGPGESPQIVGGNGSISKSSFGEAAGLETAMGDSLEVASKQRTPGKRQAIPGASVSFIRRLLTEGRDRLF
jgi:hypothetical protein